MCSIAADVMLEENTPKNLKLDLCKKCLTEKPSVILRKTDAYCKSCFLPATVHKFRATIGKYRLIRHNERVLILYQTGHPSTALLHFIQTGLELTTHKRLKLEPIVLFIDENTEISVDERINQYKKIANEIGAYNFEAYVTTLQSFINNFNENPKYIELNSNINNDSIKNIIVDSNKTISNLTQYEDAANTCRRQLLLKIAKLLNCRIVFTPEISLDVAINILSNVSLGRGANISLDVGIFDDRDPDIKILQPLRYFDMKELAFYNIFNNLEPNHIKNPNDNISTASVNTLLSKFVNDLQVNFPSTIKTVVRTGDKLTCGKNNNICRICKAPVELQDKLSSSEARDFSHWISTHCNDVANNILDYSQKSSSNDICYGCKSLTFLIED